MSLPTTSIEVASILSPRGQRGASGTYSDSAAQLRSASIGCTCPSQNPDAGRWVNLRRAASGLRGTVRQGFLETHEERRLLQLLVTLLRHPLCLIVTQLSDVHVTVSPLQ